LCPFAEADFIRDEQTRVAGHGSEDGLDLMGQDVCSGVEQCQGRRWSGARATLPASRASAS
jgi:hypothetical protein